MTLALDIPSIEKMPGGEVMRLVREILNGEAFRIETLENLLVKEGLSGTLNGERIAVIRAIAASSDAITLLVAQAEDDAARQQTDARKIRRVFVKSIADQMRAALLKGAESDGSAA
jgi:hypothetical protein